MPPRTKPNPQAEKRRAERLAEKAAKAAMNLRTKADDKPRQSIDPDKSYTRESLEQEVGLGNVWFREAVKKGLPVKPAGRFKFVMGSDLIKFINSGKGAAVSMPAAKKSK